ncbi:MAG TPA: glutamate-5-semialdehyde dehydrogenase [Opitutaceae bacterium]|nr:glutamate-5-semialdehyde dehydrogenase [Opitutaceae bacterium]
MRRTINALPRFGLLNAFGIILGTVLLEGMISLALGVLCQIASAFSLYDTANDSAIQATLQIIAKLIAFSFVGWIVLSGRRQKWRDVGTARFSPPTLALGFLPIVAAVVVFLSELDNLLRYLFPHGSGLDSWDVAPSIARLVTGSWQGVALAVIIAPLTEEFLFRGLILRGLIGRWKPWAAIVISALLFALIHLNPAQMPVAFLLGLVLGWIYVHTRSLGLCMIGHAVNNTGAYLVGFFPYSVDNFNHVPVGSAALFHPWWFDGAGVALFAFGCWIIYRLAPPAHAWVLPPEPPPVLVPPLLGQTGTIGHCQPPLLANTQPSMSAELVQLVTALAQRARAASLVMATVPSARKDAALQRLADLIDASHEPLLAANARDLASPEAAAVSAAARERLTLNAERLKKLAAAVREVIALPDPVGEVLEEINRPNGLRIRKLRVPIGVIGIIYESRPNVTVDCAILCLKSGNASILRGGKECFHTNLALAALIQQALAEAGLPADAVQLVPTTDRGALNVLLKLDTLVHCIIPRGGESLIRYVAENSTIPVIKHYKGVCFVYVDAAADLTMAESIAVNAKCQRPGVCNAAEQLLVHRDVAEKFLPSAARALVSQNVELRCDAGSAALLARENIPATLATSADYTTEFLAPIMAVRVVDSLDTAVATINRDSSNHSDAIVTADEAAARRFLAEVDSATVYWNASTRFTDGYEFGYGAEIGISTDRLHARGPMGLRELCSHKFLIEGTGQVRN